LVCLYNNFIERPGIQLFTMKAKFAQLFFDFLDSEQSSGVILILCTVTALVIANSPLGEAFLAFWQTKIGPESLGLRLTVEHWINDGLMTIFFLLIGLEIEREIQLGELSDLKSASLPIFAALGGMAVPALIHFLLNRGTVTQSGVGIPMATDIAFALGVLALLGNKVPTSLKIFLTALAIIDDLGAIIIIAVFYVSDFSLVYLLLALGVFAGLLVLNWRGEKRLAFYLAPGVFMWYFMLQSGVHATLAGVLLAFAIPFTGGDEDSPSYKLQHFLHRPVAFLIMPLFALTNTGVVLAGNWLAGLSTANSLGIIGGLLIGKPLGITLFSAVAIRFGVSQLPNEATWRQMLGAGFLGGIGFTMSIFITLLAFNDAAIVQSSKLSIFLSSLLAGICGFVILNQPKRPTA